MSFKTKLYIRINELSDQLREMSFDNAHLADIEKQADDIFNTGDIDGWLKFCKENENTFEVINLKKEIKRLENTAKQDLVKATYNYILTDERDSLVNPAGFTIDEKVYIKPSIWIEFETEQQARDYARNCGRNFNFRLYNLNNVAA